jgi:hypothetical protein
VDYPVIPPPDEAFIAAAEDSAWRAGNKALTAGGAEREDYAEASAQLLNIRDLARLWRSGAPPDPAAWPGTHPGSEQPRPA